MTLAQLERLFDPVPLMHVLLTESRISCPKTLLAVRCSSWKQLYALLTQIGKFPWDGTETELEVDACMERDAVQSSYGSLQQRNRQMSQYQENGRSIGSDALYSPLFTISATFRLQ